MEGRNHDSETEEDPNQDGNSQQHRRKNGVEQEGSGRRLGSLDKRDQEESRPPRTWRVQHPRVGEDREEEGPSQAGREELEKPVYGRDPGEARQTGLCEGQGSPLEEVKGNGPLIRCTGINNRRRVFPPSSFMPEEYSL